tara:strand:+ start:3351 stop:3998 length:648 start_codon:yes stop_codon:yes gene_type:complete
MKESYQDEVAKILLDIDAIKFSFSNPFILTSGKKSPIYVDCRKLISYTKERNLILNFAEEYFKKNKIFFDILAGGETAGIPYASFLAERLKKPMIYIRKQPKGFGKNNQIEGDFKINQTAILIEDLATDGGSKIIFLDALRKAQINVFEIFVIFYYDIFDLSQTALGNMDITLHYLCTWKNIINILQKEKILKLEDIENLKFFLNEPENWRKRNE